MTFGKADAKAKCAEGQGMKRRAAYILVISDSC